MVKVSLDLNELGKFLNDQKAQCFVELSDAVVIYSDNDLRNCIEFIKNNLVSATIEYTEYIAETKSYVYRKDIYIGGKPHCMSTYGSICTNEELEEALNI